MATKRKADFLRSRLGWAGVFLGAVAVVVVIGIISVLDAWKFVGECAVLCVFVLVAIQDEVMNTILFFIGVAILVWAFHK